MPEADLSRRNFFARSLAAGAPVLLATGGLPGLAAEPGGDAKPRTIKVVCVGAHPDDPESGCAGTLARYVGMGHAATIIYLTRGERGIQGKSNEEAAAIRSAECEAACKIMGATARFAGQIDGAADFTRTRVDELAGWLAPEHPDVVFTHWPIDTHMDHQVASMCTIRAVMALNPRPHLFFFEVDTGSQTQGFAPNSYVDVSSTLQKKKAALLAHASQNGEGIWRNHHEPIAIWRGRETGVGYAEAFVRLTRENQSAMMPGL